jgi:predicted dehydrogenase
MNPRVAIIGISGYAKILLRSLEHILNEAGGRLTAATVINPAEERAEILRLESAGCEVFADYETMLDAAGHKIDLCIIPTGIPWHAKMCVAASQRGIRSLVEKPLAGSAADARSIVDASERNGCFVAVGFQDLYTASIRQISEFLDSGELGAVRNVFATGSWPRGEQYYQRNQWAGKVRLGDAEVRDSPINNAFAHFFNLALIFSGRTRDPGNVPWRIHGRSCRHFPIETFDSTAFVIESDGHAKIQCAYTHADVLKSDPVIITELDGGVLTWNFQSRAEARRKDGSLLCQWPLESAEESRRQMLRQVLHATVRGGSPACPALLGLLHVMAIERIEKALPIRNADNRSWKLRQGVFDSLLASV